MRIRGLPFGVTPREVLAFFAAHRALDFTLKLDAGVRGSSGTGYIEFDTPRCAVAWPPCPAPPLRGKPWGQEPRRNQVEPGGQVEPRCRPCLATWWNSCLWPRGYALWHPSSHV